MTTTISMLPDGIMLDILSRLCIQDLSPCRFVCKNWYDIIKDPVFVASHHSRIGQDDPTFIILHHTIKAKVSYASYYPTCTLGEETFFLVDNQSMSTELKAKPLLSSTELNDFQLTRTLSIVGSSNGLLCLKIEHTTEQRFYYILNPITNENVPLPIAPCLGKCNRQRWKSCTSGFAFDANSKTYKVVQAWSYVSHENEERWMVVDMHTIGSGKWTRVHEISDAAACGIHETAVFVNNALHWQIYIQQFGHHICAIDVGAETFKSFKSPPEFNGLEYKSLGSIKGCLSFLIEFCGDLLVWVMKDYGVEESWVKEYTVWLNRPPKFEYPRNWLTGMFGFKTLRTMKNGNTLFYDGEHLSYNDFEKNECRFINIRGLPSSEFCKFWGFPGVVAHVGSLVSPKSIVAGEQLNLG